VGEIGYYAPGRALVLYYGGVGYFNGIIRIGRYGGCRRIRLARAAAALVSTSGAGVRCGSGEPDLVRLWVRLGGSS
jgi:hypothetical protein